MTEITLIRHGETTANQQKILQGQSNFPLNEIGMVQAKAVAERLRGEKFDRLFTSDLDRAVQTANEISKVTGLEPELTPELREWHLGELEKRPAGELVKNYPQIMDSFQHQAEGDVAVPGGESLLEFYRRVGSFLTGAALANPGKRLLMVTHGGVLIQTFRLVCGAPQPGTAKPMLSNTGVTRILYTDHQEWRLASWNDTSHLKCCNLHDSRTL